MFHAWYRSFGATWPKMILVGMEYGLGLGGGLEIWKVQVVCRYNWNFGQLFDASGTAADTADFFGNAKESVFDGKNFGGVTLSVALLF